MMSVGNTAIARRSEQLLQESRFGLFRWVDQMFAVLMGVQWLFGIFIALTLSPYAWAGKQHAVHLHVWVAVFLGGALSSLPIALALRRPGMPETRYTMAVAQMLWSALLIHLSGGRIETHFHVFGSLAFLAIYRDWRVLVPATVTVAAYHIVLQVAWPEALYGVTNPEWWRTLEHVFWVAFEDVVLVVSCIFSLRELTLTSEKRAETEALTLSEKQQSENLNKALKELRESHAALQENAALQSDIVELLKVVSIASEGDLTVRARTDTGELGNVADAFNTLMESQQQLISDIQKQQQRTTTSVGTMSLMLQRMVQGASTQAEEVVSASKLVERFSREIEQVSKNALDASGSAKRTEESADEGSQAVQDVISGMEALRANVQAGAKKMKNLGDRSMEITGIVAVINRISEQTNMLALNAAIEAARAGEHGRGFSVVAEEVRKLAERTAAATQEIEKLVKVIQTETNDTARAIEQQTAVVEQESAVVSRAGRTLVKIREVSTQASVLVVNISDAARAQVDGTQAVVRLMAQISAIAKETQSGAQGTMATTAELISASHQLSQAIGRFKVS